MSHAPLIDLVRLRQAANGERGTMPCRREDGSIGKGAVISLEALTQIHAELSAGRRLSEDVERLRLRA